MLFCLLVCAYSSNAQQAKKPQLEVTGSLNFGLIDGYSLWGAGSHAKLLFPVGQKSDALVAAVGMDRLHEELDRYAYSYTFALASIGYRKNIKSAFIEPKAGLGINIGARREDFSVFVGIEPGIQKRKFTFSMDYRFISSDGLAYGDHFHTFALRMGYKISWK